MQTKSRIISKYIFKDDYNPKYVNGAFGGLGPQGEFIINFYFERVPLPNSQTFEIIDGNSVQEIENERKPLDHEQSLVRVVENGIIMDYQHAKEIHRWLGEHLKTFEKTFLNNE
ncbi:DUF3467 domain-containing protein [Belliella sp. R4-6]|uniref:DUF3467 domain-containing protein n=1 Tax=Belliella alkalica TaxID=1730871 RepID=A0ABS9V9W3_9BACT|nr:DUF3467 domain-containing protein [Belliella alkalica]MCH7413209.1 DUF3467 domain-containing protein [Belliella alkalica]